MAEENIREGVKTSAKKGVGNVEKLILVITGRIFEMS
jgi:hypothetical protein